jgi:PhnB protein
VAASLNPYLGFKDNAREAMEFYKTVFGGKLDVNTFKDFHASDDPSEGDKIMHSQLETDAGFTFMASDTPNSMPFEPGARISMSLSGDDDAALSGWFDKLADGGTVRMPLDNAPWGDKFGMVTDQFGVLWLVNIAGSQTQGQAQG